MRIAMFGITGVVGSHLLEAVLDRGHEVHALVRAPEKITTTSDRLTTVVGDACDPAAVDGVVAGSDAVISALGGFRGPESLSAGTEAIVKAMRRHGVRRLVIVQGFHLHYTGDPRNAGKRLIVPIMKVASSAIVSHSEKMADMLHTTDVDWTVVRAPRVVRGGATGRVRTGRLRIGPWSHVTQGDVTEVVLSCLENSEYVRQAPMVAS